MYGIPAQLKIDVLPEPVSTIMYLLLFSDAWLTCFSTTVMWQWNASLVDAFKEYVNKNLCVFPWDVYNNTSPEYFSNEGSMW